MARRFAKRAPSFAVGETFAVSQMRNFVLVRVRREVGDKVEVASLPESGLGTMMFQRKASTVTRAVISPEEAAEVLAAFGESVADVADRKTRLYQLTAAQKSMDPFAKAQALAMLARRQPEPGLNTDDKVRYRQLRVQLQLELAASLGVTDGEVDGMLTARGVPPL